MPEDTIAVLERLLQEAPGAQPVYLQESRDFWDADWTAEEMETLERQFSERHAAETALIRAAWGEPTFSGGLEDPHFPDWCPGQALSYWERGDHIAYVWWEHQDQELPFLLVVGAKNKGRTGKLRGDDQGAPPEDRSR